MNTYAFLASIVHSLAWPLVVLIVVWWLRDPFADLIPLLTSIKYKDWQITFGAGIAAAQSMVDTIAPGSNSSAQKSIRSADQTQASQPSGSPRAIVESAWSSLQRAVVDFAQSQHVSADPFQAGDATALVRKLQDAGAITPQQALLFANLKGLRNTAARDAFFAPTAADAAQYAEIAGRLQRSLDQS